MTMKHKLLFLLIAATSFSWAQSTDTYAVQWSSWTTNFDGNTIAIWEEISTLPEMGTGTDEAALTGGIGAMINGTPFYGLSDAQSWSDMEDANSYGGDGHWNQEAYYSEGSTLGARYSAHTPPSGDFHSHASPYKLYEDYGTNEHSPIIGWANDGYPIYGPYGYTDSLSDGSGISLMVSGFALRSMTERNSFPGDATILPPPLRGPEVSTDYPLGMYVQDYEWDALNGGTLDEHNGRYCVTPEFPGGTYAYFITQDISGTPQFPYVIGTTYYGSPNVGNEDPSATVPAGATCLENTGTGVQEYVVDRFEVFPNPTSDFINIKMEGSYEVELISNQGLVVKSFAGVSSSSVAIQVSDVQEGNYTMRIVCNDLRSVSTIVVK